MPIAAPAARSTGSAGKRASSALASPHCYSFFAGNEDFAARWDDDFTSFFLTDFLVRQFEAFVIEPLGLDRHQVLN